MIFWLLLNYNKKLIKNINTNITIKNSINLIQYIAVYSIKALKKFKVKTYNKKIKNIYIYLKSLIFLAIYLLKYLQLY